MARRARWISRTGTPATPTWATPPAGLFCPFGASRAKFYRSRPELGGGSTRGGRACWVQPSLGWVQSRCPKRGRYCPVREGAWHRLAVWRNFVIPWAGACGASVALASGLRPAFGVHPRPSLLISGTVHREYAAATGRRLCGHAHFRFHVKLFSSPAARRGLVGHITGSFWSMKASGNGVAPVAVGPVATLPTPRSPRREPASKPVRDLGTSAPTAARGQTRAARRPECPCPGNRLTASRRTGKRKARAELKCIFDRCGQQYGADACTARGEEDARNEPQQTRQVPADHCARLLCLSAEDGRAFATDEAKVARDCR